MFKADFRKAFDTLSWEFLESAMVMLGFPDIWRGWIMTCLHSSRLSVLVNGSPNGMFAPGRGIRQGCPLSPMLFAMATEVLMRLVLWAQNRGDIKGFAAATGSSRAIPILLYADDTLLMSRASQDDMIAMKAILAWYESLSGLTINYEKSSLFGINVQGEELQGLARILGCNSAVGPTRYLGIPLLGKYKDRELWDPLLKNVDARLNVWKSKLLSKAGRQQLIKSTISSIPTFWFACLNCPASVIKLLEQRMRNFLWGSTTQKKKLHLVNWNDIALPEEWGGLGIRNLTDFNKALRLKWLWRFGMEEKALWRMVIAEKYGVASNGRFCIGSNKPFGWSLWRPILKLSTEFEKQCSFTIGRGDKTRFWFDRWSGQHSLAAAFPDLYNASANKLGLVKEFVNEETGEWSVMQSEEVWDTAAEVQLQQLRLMVKIPNFTDSEDGWEWNNEAHGFSVKKAFQALETNRRLKNGNGIANFPSKVVWNGRCPPKACIVVWQIFRHRLPCRDRLRQLGWQISGGCAMCDSPSESQEHLFLNCSFASLLWQSFRDAFAIRGPEVQLIEQIWSQWDTGRLTSKGRRAWHIAKHAVIWTLWVERNRRVFQNSRKPISYCIKEAKITIWQWLRAFNMHEQQSLDLFMCNWGTEFCEI